MRLVKTVRSDRARILIALTLCGFLCSFYRTPTVKAAPGDLDLTFGVGGKVTTDFLGGTDSGNAVAIQADGKIVVAGQAKNFPSIIAGFALERLNTDGTLDSTFGNGGRVVTLFMLPDPFGANATAEAVVIQPDGKILAAGQGTVGGGLKFLLARYNVDGSLDGTFGADGKVAAEFRFGITDGAFALALQPDGRILAAGKSDLFDHTFGLMRFLPDGSLDTDFGIEGKVTTPFGTEAFKGEAHGIAIQRDGRIVLSGFQLFPPRMAGEFFTADFALARYNTDGSLDTTFGSGGKLLTDFGGTDFGDEVVIQSDGKIVVVGTAFDGNPGYFALARYNPNGTLDTSFGSGGKVTTANTAITGAVGRALTIQKDGRILVGGNSSSGFTVARFDAAGNLDPTFGSGGVASPSFHEFGDTALSLAIQSDNKIVAAGTARLSNIVVDFAVVRYDFASFDLCIQDDSTGSLLRINSTTGDYQFTSCKGFTLDGTGALNKRGNVITLQQNGPDRRVLAKIDGSVNKGTASVQVFSQGTTVTITDRNTLNNTCSCGAH
jgi:uncharacterized delta-60 repeat protein